MTNTLSEVIQYAENHATRNGSDWNGWCEAFVHEAGGFTNAFETAHLSFEASHIYQIAAGHAPNGWLYHWDYVGSDGVNYGHIGFATPGGKALMASSFITTTIHTHLGYINAADYQTVSGHRYLGASPDHGGQFLVGIPHTPPTSGPTKPGRTLATLGTGVPNTAFYMRLQWYAHLNGYTGPIDGVMGTNSWIAVQKGLRSYGYTGPLDGRPGTYTYEALQKMAHQYGSSDPIDGSLSKADYKAIAKRLNLL